MRGIAGRIRAAGARRPIPTWLGDRHALTVGDAAVLRSLLPGVDAVCHQAAAVGHGLDPRDAPMYASNNDLATAVLLAEMYAAGVTRLVLASSMVVYGEGRYACRARVGGPARRARRHRRRRFEPRCRSGCDARLGLVPEDAPLDPRSTYAATKLARSVSHRVWARQCGGTVWALRYHNVFGPRMPRTPRTRGSPRSSVRRSRAARRRGYSRTAGRCATSSTSPTSPRPTSWR